MPVTHDPDVIDRPASGLSRPQRSVGRHDHILTEPEQLSGVIQPVSARPGQSGVCLWSQVFGGRDVAKAQ